METKICQYCNKVMRQKEGQKDKDFRNQKYHKGDCKRKASAEQKRKKNAERKQYVKWDIKKKTLYNGLF